MDAGNQQRILGYFIEEAKEHLDTLEHGILDLPSVVQDSEKVNEMFRAAHSVKGGAAMLGFSSIQRTAHRLEDSFKILKENDIRVDQKLETLFLRAYDTLKDLIEQLQGPFGLRDEEAEKTMQAAEPSFAKLQSYLESLMSSGKQTATASTDSVDKPKEQGAVGSNFGPQVMEILKQMLQLFKQQDTPASRQQFQVLCKRLVQVGAGNKAWQGLVQVSYKAIANRQNSYQVLAPVVIKELKQASDNLQTGKASAVAASPALQKLASAAPSAATPATTTPSKPAAAATPATNTAPKQITLTVEPKAAAQAIVKAFDKQQLLQLTKLLVQATRASS
ncbi:MAG TPA: histidine kinase [Cyanobacteria bacterium UBA8543]|nr:histidine kinase [Cyanobacteria bacterium UBA8543]